MTSCSFTSSLLTHPWNLPCQFCLPSYRGSSHTWEQPLFSTSPAFLSCGLLFPSAGCQGEAHLLAWPPNRCLPASLPPFSFSQSITCQGLAVAAPAVHCLTLLLLQSFLAASSEVPLPAALLCCLPAASSSCLQLSSLPPASPPLGLRAAALLAFPQAAPPPFFPRPSPCSCKQGFFPASPPSLARCFVNVRDHLSWVPACVRPADRAFLESEHFLPASVFD